MRALASIVTDIPGQPSSPLVVCIVVVNLLLLLLSVRHRHTNAHLVVVLSHLVALQTEVIVFVIHFMDGVETSQPALVFFLVPVLLGVLAPLVVPLPLLVLVHPFTPDLSKLAPQSPPSELQLGQADGALEEEGEVDG